MTDNDHSRVRQGINKLMRLKTKKSIKKEQPQQEDNNKNKFKLLSDAALHVKNLLSKYLVTMDREEGYNCDIEKKLQLLKNSKVQQPMIKLLDDSDEESPIWGKSKTRETKMKRNIKRYNSSSNNNFPRFNSKNKERPNRQNSNTLERLDSRKNFKWNIDRSNSKRSKNEESDSGFKAKSYKSVQSMSSTVLLQEESEHEKEK